MPNLTPHQLKLIRLILEDHAKKSAVIRQDMGETAKLFTIVVCKILTSSGTAPDRVKDALRLACERAERKFEALPRRQQTPANAAKILKTELAKVVEFLNDRGALSQEQIRALKVACARFRDRMSDLMDQLQALRHETRRRIAYVIKHPMATTTAP